MKNVALRANRHPGFRLSVSILLSGALVLSSLRSNAAPAGVGDPPTPKPAATEEPAPLPSDPAERRRQLEASLAEAESRLAQLSRAVPHEGRLSEASGRERQMLERLLTILKRHREALGELAEADRLRHQNEEAAIAWQGFSDPPPYSILQVDALRDAAAAAEAKRQALSATINLARDEWSRLQAESNEANAAVRRAEAEVAAAQSGAEAARARAQWEMAQLEAKLIGQRLLLIDTTRAVARQRLAATAAELQLLDRQIEVAGREVRFDETDLKKALEGVEALGNRFRDEINRLGPAVVGKGDKGITEPGPDRQELLTLVSALTEIAGNLWRARYQAVNASDPEENREALQRLQRARKEIAAWAAFARDKFTLAWAAESALTNQLFGGSDRQPSSRRPGSDELAFAQQRTRLLESMQSAASDLDRRVGSWLDEAAIERAERGWRQRLRAGLDDLAHSLKSTWHTELFTAEDTVEIDGRKVVTVRGVTVGQIAWALVFFLVSYQITVALSRLVRRILVHRHGFHPNQAEVLRHWLVNFIVLILLMITLHLAEIPLTAFAFLGGALAIGVGFGTQTLFRNLISGIIVLLEHKVEVGDIIEVDGILGTVTSVDLRAATVRGFDDTEAFIPNSTLLEQKLVNWTYSHGRQRRIIRVGVAYGSPVRKVIEVLADCAHRHGLVLDEPKPMALLEDFGDSGLIFGLYFWVDVTNPVPGIQVVSDVRVMIEKAFREAGIVIAYPRRDIRLETNQPPPAERVATGSAPAAPESLPET